MHAYKINIRDVLQRRIVHTRPPAWDQTTRSRSEPGSGIPGRPEYFTIPARSRVIKNVLQFSVLHENKNKTVEAAGWVYVGSVLVTVRTEYRTLWSCEVCEVGIELQSTQLRWFEAAGHALFHPIQL